jgi:tRNA (guanine10-N2)-dimethyltransferase
VGEIYSKKVNLKAPEKVIRIVITNDSVYAGFMIYNDLNKSIRARKNEFRPFRTTVSLSPNYARLLVNLARVKEKDTILDPFCGGGSILIEASTMGINAYGSDIDDHMVLGAKTNLEHFALKGTVYQGDVSKITEYFDRVDAIVTDPPYGRSAFINKEKVSELYNRSFREFKKLVKYKGCVAIILPHYDHIKLAAQYFKLVEYHKLKVHRSLDRYFCVFEKV